MARPRWITRAISPTPEMVQAARDQNDTLEFVYEDGPFVRARMKRRYLSRFIWSHHLASWTEDDSHGRRPPVHTYC